MPEDTKTHRILKMIMYLSNSSPKSLEECTSYLGIKNSTFYDYQNLLKDTGFEIVQANGKYKIEYRLEDHKVLKNILHFTDEENFLLARVIDQLDEKSSKKQALKNKIIRFLNHDDAIERYIRKEKPEIVKVLNAAIKQKRKILFIIGYANAWLEKDYFDFFVSTLNVR
jgi:proteasome accessory factor C